MSVQAYTNTPNLPNLIHSESITNSPVFIPNLRSKSDNKHRLNTSEELPFTKKRRATKHFLKMEVSAKISEPSSSKSVEFGRHLNMRHDFSELLEQPLTTSKTRVFKSFNEKLKGKPQLVKSDKGVLPLNKQSDILNSYERVLSNASVDSALDKKAEVDIIPFDKSVMEPKNKTFNDKSGLTKFGNSNSYETTYSDSSNYHTSTDSSQYNDQDDHVYDDTNDGTDDDINNNEYKDDESSSGSESYERDEDVDEEEEEDDDENNDEGDDEDENENDELRSENGSPNPSAAVINEQENMNMSGIEEYDETNLLNELGRIRRGNQFQSLASSILSSGNLENSDDEDVSLGPQTYRFNSSFHPFRSAFSAPGVQFGRLLEGIKDFSDPTVQMLSLQELSEAFAMSTEDMLVGLFSTDSYIAAFSEILSGRNYDFGEVSIQLMLSCTTCVSNMMEALPLCMAKIAYSPIVRILCERMFDMQYIDIAEQALGVLERLSKDFGICILEHRGMLAALQYFDFFYTTVQRTAISLAANCCKFLDESNASAAEEIIPLLSNILQSSDTIVVSKAYSCLETIIESLKTSPNIIETIISEDLITTIVNALTNSTSQNKSMHLQVQLLHIISSLCQSSSALILPFLNHNLPDVMYEMLCGIPPSDTSHQADMITMQSLYYCPIELIENLLRAITSLLPKNTSNLSDEFNTKLYRLNSILLTVVMDIYFIVPLHDIRSLAVTTALKMLCSIRENNLDGLVCSLPLSSFIASILNSRKSDNFLKRDALEMCLFLLEALPNVYSSLFIREGVVQEVGFLVRSTNADMKKIKLSISFSQNKSAARHEELKNLSTLKSLAKEFLSNYKEENLENSTLVQLKQLSKHLLSETKQDESFSELAKIFQEGSNITSHELLHSGLIHNLLLSLKKFGSSSLRTFLLAMNTCDEREVLEFGNGPLISLIFCLQNLLSTVENFQLSTLPPDTENAVDHVFSRQFKLRLMALPGSRIRPPFRSLVVSINGLATIRTLDNYLHSRISVRNETGRRFSILREAGSLRESMSGSSRNSSGDYTDSMSQDAPNHTTEPSERRDSSTSSHFEEHFVFSLMGKKVPRNKTIFRILYEYIQLSDDHTLDDFWKTPVPIFYGEPDCIHNDMKGELNYENETEGFSINIREILDLLSILYYGIRDVHTLFPDKHFRGNIENILTDFSNWKLSAKLNRQLEEQQLVVHGCLPSWCISLTSAYPFLVPFETRYLLLQSTAFGLSRSVSFLLSRNPELSKNESSSILQFVSLHRQKIRISRKKIFNYALHLLATYAASENILEIEYEDEVGSGLGPTLEFYTSVSKEFTLNSLDIWRNDQPNSKFVYQASGLFPSPIPLLGSSPENERKISLFFALGQFVARSIYDSRIISIQFNPLFFARNIPLTISSVAKVDKGLANSLRYLEKLIPGKNPTNAETDIKLEDLHLDFTLPGFPSIELIPDGASTPVTTFNVSDYLNYVIDYTVGKGVQQQLEAFQNGFSSVFPYTSLQVLTEHELVTLFGTVDEDWSYATLMKSIVADHGYTMESPTIQRLLTLMSQMNFQEQRDFLQFITGSRKLPIGGFAGLNPPLTVVRRLNEPPYVPDDYLPSVMTCVNYLKLPEYSSSEVLGSRLSKAILEGQGSFHLS